MDEFKRALLNVYMVLFLINFAIHIFNATLKLINLNFG
ncbi:hypothetical protein FUAX_18330 [Fulvitalea axinellae]|uniref:Succinate dehydrogenase n=1 Tax=Fulvitalea axinellae TaxID=1182444 RepID=A0AAU9D923_9BACT|nr:hypothetical protein FUAX_18330 [Fulvitalea axinellae]